MTTEEKKQAQREAAKRYNLRHPERRAASNKKYYAKNKAKCRALSDAWDKAHAERRKMQAKARRERIKALGTQ